MSSFLEDRVASKSQTLTLVELLLGRAHQHPDRLAFTFLHNGEVESDRLTYHLLDQKARAIAAELQGLTKPGDRALLLYPSGLEFISAFFGCLYAGVVAVPAYPPRANQNFNRLQAIVSDAQAHIALTTAALLPNLEQRWAADPTVGDLNWLATDAVEISASSAWQFQACQAHTLAFLQYTSGSTGNPKGVMVTHENLLHNERMIERAFGHGEQTISVGWLPLFHDMGLVGNVLQPLYMGTPCTLLSPVDFLQKPVRWLKAIAHYQATSSGGPNFAYDLCVRKVTAAQREELDLSSWDLAFSGAEPIRAETLDKFAETFASCGFRREAFYPCYGMAEATLFITGGLKANPPVVCQVDPDALQQHQIATSQAVLPNASHLVGCGQPWFEQTVRVVHPETHIECALGQVGEIWVAGSSVTQGYWNQPAQTEQTFRAWLANTREGPFLRTGDLGFLLDDELFVTGRLKDVLIVRGRNHYPQDIELTVEQSHPAIRRPGCCAAFMVDREGEERLVVVAEVERRYRERRRQADCSTTEPVERRQSSDRRQTVLDQGCEPEANQPCDAEQIFGDIRQEIAEHHQLQPYAILLLRAGSIPRTSSGKIQRHACREKFVAASLAVIAEWVTPALYPVATLEQTVEQAKEESVPQPLHSWSLSQDPAQRQQTIEDWLISHITQQLRVQPQAINVQDPFTRFGLDSIQVVSLVVSLEEWLGYELLPDLLERHPTISSLSQHLSVKTMAETTIDTGQQQTDTRTAQVPPSSLQSIVSDLFWQAGRFIYHHWFQLQSQGLEYLPLDQPFLLAANHTSHLDAAAVMVALTHQVDRVAVLGAKDYFFNFALKEQLFRTFFNMIPFERQGSFLEALHECQQVLAPRCPILLFPEGTRSQTGELQSFQAGLGFLALKLQTPVIPVHIEGAYQALPKGRWVPQKQPIRVSFGAPIELLPYQNQRGTMTERELCEILAKDVRHAVQALQGSVLTPLNREQPQ